MIHLDHNASYEELCSRLKPVQDGVIQEIVAHLFHNELAHTLMHLSINQMQALLFRFDACAPELDPRDEHNRQQFAGFVRYMILAAEQYQDWRHDYSPPDASKN